MNAHPWRQRLYHVVLWAIAIIFFLPVLWIFLAAFKTGGELVSPNPVFLFRPTMENIIRVVQEPNFLDYLKMSFILSIGSVLIAIGVSFLAAYSFSRYRPTGTNFIMFLLLSTRMVPASAVVLPIFLMYNVLGWSKTFHGMILFYAMFSIPFSLWILKGFLDGVSLRYDETALRSEEHTSELQSRLHLVCRLLLEKKN